MSEIKLHPEISDNAHSDHSNRDVRIAIFEGISALLGITSEYLSALLGITSEYLFTFYGSM